MKNAQKASMTVTNPALIPDRFKSKADYIRSLASRKPLQQVKAFLEKKGIPVRPTELQSATKHMQVAAN